MRRGIRTGRLYAGWLLLMMMQCQCVGARAMHRGWGSHVPCPRWLPCLIGDDRDRDDDGGGDDDDVADVHQGCLVPRRRWQRRGWDLHHRVRRWGRRAPRLRRRKKGRRGSDCVDGRMCCLVLMTPVFLRWSPQYRRRCRCCCHSHCRLRLVDQVRRRCGYGLMLADDDDGDGWSMVCVCARLRLLRCCCWWDCHLADQMMLKEQR